ncbi:MAG: iron-containing alcohol dehydrogenase [Pirellulales bacterium]|nr:iron-containing alcohol dehydrogenase [Pirellulales bacterium]
MGIQDGSMAIDDWKRIVDEPVIQLLDSTGQRYGSRLEDLSVILRELGADRVFLVLDRVAIHAAGVAEILDRALEQIDTLVFDAFSPNPSCGEAAAAAEAAAGHRAEAVVAIGGGSCIDVAKVAALAAPHPERIHKLVRGEEIENADPLPIVAVPTTSGTGSETTHFAVIYVDCQKASIAHTKLRPIATILDLRLHQAMPDRLAAVTGLDALGQAIESFWAVGSTPRSCEFAQSAGPLIVRSIERSVLERDPHARLGMMIGSHLAGQAINISKTTAAHAISYQLTEQFNVPHGHAVALTLGYIGAANYEINEMSCIDSRGPDFVRSQVAMASGWLPCAPADLPDAVADLMARLGLPSNLSASGVDLVAIPDLAAAANPLRLTNNPRRLSVPEITEILNRAS